MSNLRIAVFIDYWNLQLTLNQAVGRLEKTEDYRAKINWQDIGHLFAESARAIVGRAGEELSYEGCFIYTSFNPSTDEGRKFRNWALTWLNRQPGNNVQVRERKPKALPKCPACHRSITHCPHSGCGKPIVATVEKGIDTLLVTDLVRMVIGNAFDVAVIASSDADMVPAVEFIQTLGKKVIQAGFPPNGVDLATRCWGSFDIMKIRNEITRA
jgi:uncharacterized LabA/DUF88 family protein